MLKKFLKNKKVQVILIIIILIIIILPFASYRPIYDKSELTYGVTFSARYVEEMGLDWKAAYLDMLDDLRVKKLRLPAYWNEIEYKPDIFDFADLDWQITEASERNVEIILAIGGRLPRWPECHYPEWLGFTKSAPSQEVAQYLKKVVERYRGNPNIIAWQVENEPFLTHFGECPEINQGMLEAEISLVKELDSPSGGGAGRPIIITDSGELSLWFHAMEQADIFGTTMYRDVYSSALGRYIHYPIPPSFFRLKYNLARSLIVKKPKDYIVIELQAEPWGPKPYYTLTKAERSRTMDIDKFREILEYSRQTGFQEFYLWGVEWWYWEKTVNNDDSLWNEAKTLFN
ncbi:MAG: beta-galactosidase [bacterium]|nr:beta-galactosidase [bacterium]